MRFYVNNDGGRLSRHLRQHLRVLPLPPDFDVNPTCDDLRKAVGTLRAPFVLFLHAEAKPLLTQLQYLRERMQWPGPMRGVVVFRAMPYAGMASEREVASELANRGLRNL